ncbi:hypothetical protein BDR26DRAFT_852311 [Obelidium mucronatum]|nr:hypothetical protein BDR26DRAFT_852311 [Obelidium mucronatum]
MLFMTHGLHEIRAVVFILLLIAKAVVTVPLKPEWKDIDRREQVLPEFDSNIQQQVSDLKNPSYGQIFVSDTLASIAKPQSHNRNVERDSILDKLVPDVELSDSPKIQLDGVHRDVQPPPDTNLHQAKRGQSAYDAIVDAMKNQEGPKINLGNQEGPKINLGNPPSAPPAQESVSHESTTGTKKGEINHSSLSSPTTSTTTAAVAASPSPTDKESDLQIPAPPRARGILEDHSNMPPILLNRGNDHILEIPPEPVLKREPASDALAVPNAPVLNNENDHVLLVVPPAPVLKRHFAEKLEVPAAPVLKREPEEGHLLELPVMPVLKREPGSDILEVPAPPLLKRALIELPGHTVLYNFSDSLAANKTGALYEISTLIMILGFAFISLLYVLNRRRETNSNETNHVNEKLQVNIGFEYGIWSLPIKYTAFLLIVIVGLLDRFETRQTWVIQTLKTMTFGPEGDHSSLIVTLLGAYKVSSLVLFPSISRFISLHIPFGKQLLIIPSTVYLGLISNFAISPIVYQLAKQMTCLYAETTSYLHETGQECWTSETHLASAGTAGALLVISTPFFILTSNTWQNTLSESFIKIEPWATASSTTLQILIPLIHIHTRYGFEQPYTELFVSLAVLAISLQVSKSGVCGGRSKNVDFGLMRMGFILSGLVAASSVAMDSRFVCFEVAAGISVIVLCLWMVVLWSYSCLAAVVDVGANKADHQENSKEKQVSEIESGETGALLVLESGLE